MKKERRRGLNPGERAKERGWISLFVLTCVKTSPGKSILIRDVFAAYKAFVKQSFEERSKLTLDGFGRMFPKHFKRGGHYFPERRHRVTRHVYGHKCEQTIGTYGKAVHDIQVEA